VELLVAILFLAAFLKLGYSYYLIEILVLFSGLVIVSFIDLDSFILPDRYTLTGIALGLFGALVNPERSFWDAFAGVLFGGGFFWAVAYLYFVLRKEDGLGGGDIKLLAWLGAVLGWKSIPFIIIVGSFAGIVGALLSTKKNGLKTVIPFGPYLAFGGVLYFFFGEWISQVYLEFFLPMIFIQNPNPVY
jgi:leader peptidase (prepilin peptidase)/N-methyltransferase